MTEQKVVISQDYWDIVVGQLKKRPSVIVSAVVLIGLYAVAIFAPLIANDRPLYFQGVDLAAFRKAQRELMLTSNTLAQHVIDGAELGELKRERNAIELRTSILRKQLADSDRILLNEFDELMESVITEMSSGRREAAAETARSARDLAERIRAEMKPVAPGQPAVSGQSVELQSYRDFPALRNLSKGEIFFMTLWALIMLSPLWNPIVNATVLGGGRLRIRKARRPKALALVLIPAVFALLWQGETSKFYVSEFKARLTSGDIVATNILFPLIPYGIAESNDSEYFRPPTWHLEAAISEDGYYVSGPRSGRVDEATGLMILPEPVDVRFGEQDRNSPVRHAMGTDSLGRDLLARICWGGRVSLAVGLVSTAILVFIGTIIGSIAGFYGGWIDMILSRIIEIVQTFPVFFLILILVAFLGPSIINIMVVLGLVRWTGVARLVRGEFIRLREQEFVVASQALGVRNLRTIFRHVLPNAMGPVLVAATFSVAAGILIESGLSFLGFGIQLPIPSWGSLFIESRSAEHWWIQIFPGLLIFLTVLLYNWLGEGVRDALDPRLKGAD